MPIEVLEYEYLVLKTKLEQCERLDLWGRWTWEEDEKLRDIERKLRKMGKKI